MITLFLLGSMIIELSTYSTLEACEADRVRIEADYEITALCVSKGA